MEILLKTIAKRIGVFSPLQIMLKVGFLKLKLKLDLEKFTVMI
jgi:hypothetical protein